MVKNKYPIYIISKGRYEKPLTALLFDNENIDYLIAVEPQEYDLYCDKLGAKRVLKLPFSNLGLGSYPARNYCWEHAKANGYKYHWLFDDNIKSWHVWQNKKRVNLESILKALLFVEKYTNINDIDLAGFERKTFSVTVPKKPFRLNSHVYSTLLIKNSLPYRWRLKYNEDIDLCLQVLHNGGKTANCIYYLAEKVPTSHKMKGGNQTELYQGNAPKKNLLKAKMLEAVWPQYAKTVIRFGRHHHLINWKIFKK
ncbi:MAG: hypothetical protein RL308_1308 [Bacteroidota bacterium]|jgi:hypothetical protein